MNSEIGLIDWRGNMLMIMVGFKINLSEDNLMLGRLKRRACILKGPIVT
jgi:hypothetical protein